MTTLPLTLKGQEFVAGSFSVPTGLSIAGLADGDTVVAWQDGQSAAVQLFSPTGTAVSNETLPVPIGGGFHAATNENVIALANGNFVLTLNDTVVIGSNTYVTVDAQIYDPNLNPVGNLVTVIPQFLQTAGFTGADVFATPDGGFAYAESINQSETVQAFHADGSQNGAAIQTGGTFNNLLGATALTNGDYVTLTGNHDSFWVYDKSGNQIVGQTSIAGGNAGYGDIAALPDGRFVIVYDTFGTDAVNAQIYNPDGSTFGNEIAVNNGMSSPLGLPHVSTMPGGRFVVSWDDANSNLTDVRVFNPDGTPATDVFAIPGSYEASPSGFNDVTALSATSFAVDWKTNATIEGQVLSVPAPTTPAGTTADLILRETMGANTGQLNAFDLGNNSILAAYPLGGLGLNWQVMGLGAFAGIANEADMLMRDSNTGNIEYFDIQGGQFTSTGAMGSVGVNWQVLGTGDFSGNANETDMLIRNSNTGAIDYFDIQHNQIVAAGSVATIGPEWQTLGVGDFSGNAGEADMLMRNINNGAIDYIDIQHNQIVAAGSMGTIGTNWQVLGFGDFSGNANETDMILRDSNTGNLNYFDIQHNQIVGAGPMGSIGVNWQPVGFADVSGLPGESDMILRDSNTGNFGYFDIQHNQIVSAGPLGNVGTDWHTLGVGTPLVLGHPLV